jgi:arylamine N-acetyltransferase
MSAWLERYLRLLDLDRENPSLDALGRLCRAHVAGVPFENVTAILRRRQAGDAPAPPVDFDALLSAWEARGGGGVCVDSTPMFRRLLEALGYSVRPVLARISFPASHQASIVTLEGREYLADVANGAPFFDPVPIDEPTTRHHAGLGWRFHRPTADTLVQDREIDGAWTSFCYYTLTAATDADIEAAYQRHHTPGQSWVVGNLTMVRCFEDEVVRLRDDELVRYTASGASTQHVTPSDLPALVRDTFGLPALPVLAAVDALDTLRAVKS